VAAEAPGICPLCESRTGAVGDPCPSEVCGRKGYRFIPVGWHESAKAYAARKQRPLDPLLGRSIDRYLLAGKLGEGGMGAVYLAIQRPLNREVALKVISGLEMTQTTIARFEREARSISVLDHPNIVKLYDYGVGELEFRVPYMALEYVKHGRTLRRALWQIRQDSGGAPITGDVVLSVFSQVLHALETAHGVGIIHRDMKPDNVMLAPVAGNPHFVKVLDFGLAKAVADVTGFDGTVSRTGQFLGTPCYMAPEQAPRKGQPSVDGRADLYAVAVMLFEVFTGVRPFEGDTPIEVLTKKVDPSHDPLSCPEARPLPRALKAFLSRGMAADPGARFGDAQEMLAAFRDALSGRRATAVGTAPGRPGSSDERPATPASPGVRESGDAEPPVEPAALEPTTPLGGGGEARPVWTGVPSSRVEGRRRKSGRRVLAAAGAAVAAVAVLTGVYVAAGGQRAQESVPVTSREREPAPQPAPLPETATVPASVPAPGPEPVPVAVSEPGPAPVPKPAGLRVRFASEPAGAEVWLGGRRLGKTPFDAALEGEPGRREFAFRLKGYREELKAVEVADGGAVRAELRPEPPQRKPGPNPKPKPVEPPPKGPQRL